MQGILDGLVKGTRAVLKSPFLLLGLMFVSLLVKRFSAPNKEGDGR